MDKSERLTQFVEWVAARRASALQTSELSRVGAALLEESGGGRVTESHILTVGDHLGGGASLALVHECGELFLRFEEAQRQAGAPAVAPPKRTRGSAAGLTPPAFPVETPPSPVVERPPDVQPPLRPPERIATHSEPVLSPSPVTFTRPSQPALAPSSTPGGLGLPLPSPRETQPIAGPPPLDVRASQRVTGAHLAPVAPPPATTAAAVPTLSSIAPAGASATRTTGPTTARTTGTLPVPELRRPGVRDSQRITGAANAFRCPRCAVMVVPGPDGNCPKCGANPPHALTLPSASAPPPAATRAGDGRGFNWLPLVAVVAVGVVGSMVGIKWGRMACDANRGGSVAGEVSIDRLGVHMFFPAGWRQHKAVDQVQPMTRGVTAHALGYYRGSDSDDPETGLVLTIAERLPVPPAQQRELTDGELRLLVEGVRGNLGAGTELQPCEIVEVGLRRTGRCTGETTDQGRRRRIVLYVWTMEPQLGVARFVGQASIAELVAEADEIVGTIEPLAHAAK